MKGLSNTIRKSTASRGRRNGRLLQRSAVAVAFALAVAGMTAVAKNTPTLPDTSPWVIEHSAVQVPASFAALVERVQPAVVNVAVTKTSVSPLSRLRNSLELLNTRHAEDPESRRALIEQSVAEADGLLSTFNALLRIARIESGERRAAFAPVDLQQLLRDLVEFYAPLAEERQQGLELRVNSTPLVGGDRDLLFQAFANLLDNAIKYTPPQGHINVDLSEQEGHPWVSVADSGPGIPARERDKVFRRFYRLEESRGLPGNVLGLSLVAAVAKLHDIKLGVEDNAPGLRIIMEFALV